MTDFHQIVSNGLLLGAELVVYCRLLELFSKKQLPAAAKNYVVRVNRTVAVGQLKNEQKLTIKLHKVERSCRFG